LLIPGRGEPTVNGVVVIEAGSIVYAGDVTGAPETPAADVVSVATVMPGFVGVSRPLRWDHEA